MTAAPVEQPRHPDASLARGLLRWHFQIAHALLDHAIDRLPLEVVNRCPAGSDVSAGVRYAHVVFREDLSVNGVLGAGKPLALSTWSGRTGLSEIPPLLPGPEDWRAWAHRVRLDPNRLRAYARAVYASTDAYIAALADEALDLKRVETPVCLLSALLFSVSKQRGEICSLLALSCRRRG